MAQELKDNNGIPRREFLGSLVKFGVAVVAAPTVLVTAGCGPALFLRAGVPRLAGVAWGAVRTRAALGTATRASRFARRGATRLTAKALIDNSDWYINPKATPSEMERLENEHPQLFLVDDRDREFETPYGIFEDVGVIQSCYRDEPRYLFAEPDFDSRQISELSIGEEVGVISLDYTSRGWYQIQTTSRDKGWIHGNCLEPLPASKYYS